MPSTTHQTPPAPATAHSMPLLAGGALLALLLILLLFRNSGSRASGKKLDPKAIEKAKKRYIAQVGKRLSGKVEQYSVLLEARNMVAGFYEQKGQIIGARFTAKHANCSRCKAMNGKEFSLLRPEKLAAATPPLHGEARRGAPCVATLVPIRAEAERPGVKPKR